MTISFSKIIGTVIDSMEHRMDTLHAEYIHLFESSTEDDADDIQELVNRVQANMDGICVSVAEIGERILARRKKSKEQPKVVSEPDPTPDQPTE